MSQKKSIACDICDEVGFYTKAATGGAQRKPDGWGIVRYETKKGGQYKVYRKDLCPKHSKEFEAKYLKGESD